jgi:5-(carboxyamino)imidazole ribonucleotide synthase
MKSRITPGGTLGIMGGGQLGRMTALAAAELGIRTHIFTDQENSPASHVAAATTVANYTDDLALRRFAKTCDIITFEFENIPHESVQLLEKYSRVRPSWEALHIAQNRLREKDFFKSLGLNTAPYRAISSLTDLKKAQAEIGPNAILKTTELGYDGKGQWQISSNTNLEKIWNEASHISKIFILEGLVSFQKELSVIIARDSEGGSIPYVPVENIHKKGILDTTTAPALISESITDQAWEIAHTLADALEIEGLLAIEMFLTNDEKLLINEIAPRPHNSGHWTIDACITSQFEQFVRAICGLPLGASEQFCAAIMKNLIGDDVKLWSQHIADPDCKVHIYGKHETREGRKMGHITRLILE